MGSNSMIRHVEKILGKGMQAAGQKTLGSAKDARHLSWVFRG
jgi:hypothetical protein